MVSHPFKNILSILLQYAAYCSNYEEFMTADWQNNVPDESFPAGASASKTKKCKKHLVVKNKEGHIKLSKTKELEIRWKVKSLFVSGDHKTLPTALKKHYNQAL